MMLLSVASSGRGRTEVFRWGAFAEENTIRNKKMNYICISDYTIFCYSVLDKIKEKLHRVLRNLKQLLYDSNKDNF